MEELSKKQISNIINELEDYYGIKELKLDYSFMIDAKNKVYLINKEHKLL